MASEVARDVLNKLTDALDPLGTPYALVGGLALAIWSYPRATRDVDVLVGVDSQNAQPIIDALLAIGCRAKTSPPVHRLGEHSFVHLLYTPEGEFYDVQFDLLLAETELQLSALSRSVIREVPGVDRPLRVLNCDDLILFKLVSGRLIDRADAAMLLRENHDALDFDYLGKWVSRLQLSAEIREIWTEALPGQQLPNGLR